MAKYVNLSRFLLSACYYVALILPTAPHPQHFLIFIKKVTVLSCSQPNAEGILAIATAEYAPPNSSAAILAKEVEFILPLALYSKY